MPREDWCLVHVHYSGMPRPKNVRDSERILPRSSAFDVWFRPKGFESERLYGRLGALLIKRYVPTGGGGDLVMQRLRHHHPSRRWVTSSLQSLCRYERRTRLSESIHLIGFMGFTILAASKFASGSLTAFGLTVALILNLILGLWPVVLCWLEESARIFRSLHSVRETRSGFCGG
jgi:hypothetical protein